MSSSGSGYSLGTTGKTYGANGLAIDQEWTSGFLSCRWYFSTQVEAAGLQFLPLPGNADFDDHCLGEPIPELWTAPGIRPHTMTNAGVRCWAIGGNL